MVACDNVPITAVTTFTANEPCDVATSPDTKTYCIHTDGLIYAYDGAASTCAIKAADVYAFTSNGAVGATHVALGSNIEITDGELLLYRCSYGHKNKLSCSRTYGYALINGNVYTVKSDNTVGETALNTITTDCKNASHFGTIIGDRTLCLKVDQSNPLKTTRSIDDTTATPNYYIMLNKSGNIFTGTEADNKNIVVEARPNAIVLDSDGNDKNFNTNNNNTYDYCVDDTDNSLTATFEEFCDNEIYGCTVKAEREVGNVWKRDDETYGCTIVIGGTSSGCQDNGYYLVDGITGSLDPKEEGSNYLAYCSDYGRTCTVVDSTYLRVGYYKYAGKAGKYIQCTGYKQCSVIEVEEKTNCEAATAVGSIINNENDVLCLSQANGYNGIPLNANADYFAKGVAGNIFNTEATEKYVKVNVVAGSSVVLSDKLGSDAVTYAYTDTDLKAYERAAGKTNPTVCAASATIVEFKHVVGDCPTNCGSESPYYVKTVEYQWPASRN
ncbi:hypothetical protein PIROE2DRAFT_2187 [Piromyces sp. E2]|nr:hypothetical protein PIROE2DRAFT_2187 [Piromyces sp. E2]|eukprot:OUM69765.1 hypothetical protein PIROE2DRAFT_2187 [Piromyces sp. E2]